MSWQDVATILYSEGTLEEAFYQIAPCAEEYHNQTSTFPTETAETVGFAIVGNIADDTCCYQYEYASAYATFPTLGWTDARKELMLAEKRTAAIGTGIIGPEENENAQRQQHVVMYLAIEG